MPTSWIFVPLSLGRSEEGSGGESILLDPMLWLSNELWIDFQKGGATRMKRFTGLDILYKDFKVQVL